MRNFLADLVALLEIVPTIRLISKKETGRWTTGAPQSEKQLTLEQAIEKARLHRDQLLKGVELLERFPAKGTDEDYERLQLEMNRGLWS